MKGLRNLGNTCFMNAGLQLLLNCDELNNKLLKYKKKCKCSLFRSYIKLLIEYKTKSCESCESCESLDPSNFKSVLDKRYPLFSNFSQEDIYEFITLFLSGLYEDLLKCGINNKTKDVLHNVIGIDSTIIIKPNLKTELNLEHKTKTLDYVLHLELDKNEDPTKCIKLENLIINTTLPKKIGNVNFDKYNLESSRNISLDNFSKCLIIYLGRYKEIRSGKNFKYQKLHNKIIVPKIIEGTTYNYHLRSFALHNGNNNGGHYVSYVKTNGQWYYLNDSSCTTVSEKEALNYAKDAYIICYHI
jgi:ubiquitin C-terminal hydrolase